MPDTYFSLDSKLQSELLNEAFVQMNRPPQLLEKDIWVVWTLEALFSSGLKDQITFKGGTALSKAYKMIDRFSEDVDLTYDIRCLLPDIRTIPDAMPSTSSQAKKWTEAVRSRLPGWIRDAVIPVIQSGLDTAGISAKLSIGGTFHDTLMIDYQPLFEGSDYVKPQVRLEFGARSTGEPWEVLAVHCDIASSFPEIVFPQISPRVMKMERTFWEKATALHVFCKQAKIRGERFSRHWHDVAILADVDRIHNSLMDKSWLEQVVRHKSMFFRENDTRGNVIAYHDCLQGHLSLVPDGEILNVLRKDYNKMVQEGFMSAHAVTFDAVMGKCAEVEARINRAYGASGVRQPELASGAVRGYTAAKLPE
jgi:hypothetical protein